MAFSLFERSDEREGGAVAEGSHQRGCGDVPHLLMCEILYYHKTCGESEGNNSPNRLTRKVPTYWLQTTSQRRQRCGEDKDGEWSICSQQGGQKRGFDEFSPSCLLSGVKGQLTRIGQSRAPMSLLALAAPKEKEIEITVQGSTAGVQNNIELPVTR